MSIYRETPRFTGDIDVTVIDTDRMSSEELANEVLSKMGYAPILGFVPDPRAGGEQVRAFFV